jgi:LemA protein
MKKGTIIGIAVAVVLLLLLGGGCSSYNGMVDAELAVQKQWAQVENQYQRRADLIPNLVNTVKGYASHESSTLENVTNARAGVATAQQALEQAESDVNAISSTAASGNVAAYQQAQSALKGALDVYVNAVHEAYPELKANESFLNLQAQLEGTENRVSTERRAYNEAVEAYNKKVLRFPGRIFASIFGFESKDMFQADAEAQHAPTVDFGTN